MKFVRDRVIVREDTGPNSTTPTVVPAVRDLVLGDVTVTTVDTDARLEVADQIALPAAFNEEATFELNIGGHQQLFVVISTEALGAGGLTGVNCLIEFQHPDDVDTWLPSKENANREAGAAVHEWSLPGTGTFIVATREEPPHFNFARVRFRAAAGAADAATLIRAYWHHNGKPPAVPDQGLRSSQRAPLVSNP